jgi:hypothetical protein
MECSCQKCGMSVKDMKCGKCDSKLVEGSVNHQGKNVKVAKCPKGCGMIKSPTCCGQDMSCLV